MEIDFNKNNDGLVPAIIQDAVTRKVLMLGYMNQEAMEKTTASGKVTFYSRTRKRLWTKGEESGNFLHLVSIKEDCDGDTLLISARPAGPTCHTGADTCWQEENLPGFGFLTSLEDIIADRKQMPQQEELPGIKPSYVQSLFREGINKIAQKVGEEAFEVVIEAKDSNDELFINESADLLFHYLILLQAKGFRLADVAEILRKRH
jgi:phosphoribosyl-ATP pyrophosphohydrolase/phosphoribosyl-AMP cyclohydrolase